MYTVWLRSCYAVFMCTLAGEGQHLTTQAHQSLYYQTLPCVLDAALMKMRGEILCLIKGNATVCRVAGSL